MKVAILCILTFFLFFGSAHASKCERAFLDPLVYRMCTTEEAMIENEYARIKIMKENLTKNIMETATKVGKNKELEKALASKLKTPSEEYLINSFIYKHKEQVEEINYAEWKIEESKKEMDRIMEEYFERKLAKK